jgi:predicted pyridoxine 5'-phosphate oxidase superfamily flavin-nucleotide-binding protein
MDATPAGSTRLYSSDVAFTPSVKAIQARRGSRKAYAQREEAGGWPTRITPDLADFIAGQTSVFLATANKHGQPYIQHRGGPPGFLRVLDDKTIGFADFVGTGNTSRSAISPTIRRSISSSSTTCIAAASKSGARRASSKAMPSSCRS